MTVLNGSLPICVQAGTLEVTLLDVLRCEGWNLEEIPKADHQLLRNAAKDLEMICGNSCVQVRRREEHQILG